MTYFEWDEEKAQGNLRKHGISFPDAAAALLGLAATRPNPRDGENRFMSFCISEGRVITVVWTPRLNAIRVISARAARKNEEAQFYESLGRSTEARRH